MSLLKQEFWRRLDLPPEPFTKWLVIGEAGSSWFYFGVDRRLDDKSILRLANACLENWVVTFERPPDKFSIYLVDRRYRIVQIIKPLGEPTININAPEESHFEWPLVRTSWTKKQQGEVVHKKPVPARSVPAKGLTLVK